MVKRNSKYGNKIKTHVIMTTVSFGILQEELHHGQKEYTGQSSTTITSERRCWHSNWFCRKLTIITSVAVKHNLFIQLEIKLEKSNAKL